MAYEHDLNLLMQAHFTLFSRGVLILSLNVRDFFSNYNVKLVVVMN